VEELHLRGDSGDSPRQRIPIYGMAVIVVAIGNIDLGIDFDSETKLEIVLATNSNIA
jgi:hypothetical protein